MRPLLACLLVALALTACAPRDTASGGHHDAALPTGTATPQDAFWENLRMHCGNAYPGGLTLEPPGDDMLTGEELLIVHFRECSDREIRLPFHIEQEDDAWDRSRTWVFMRTADGIELRHDHRKPDGTEDEQTWYGGHTHTPGTAYRQVFIFTDYDEYDPAGPQRGWRVEIVPHERYTYGTFRGEDWRWRVDFDLSEPIAAPPPPWGFE
jgi:hypothetical protein